MRFELFVDGCFIGSNGEDDVDRVLLDFGVDLGDARVILRIGMGVITSGVQMTFSVVGFDDAAQFSISSVVESSIG